MRHGETRFNAEKRLTGQIDLPLTATGEQQADAIGARLAALRLDLLLSSTLVRAQHTAEIIGRRHDKSPNTDSWLNERFCGALEGLTKLEMKQKFPDARKAYKSRHLNLAIEGGGETSQQFHSRVATGMNTLARENIGKTVVAVCHGGTIREAFNLVFDTCQNGNHLRCVNGSVSIFHYTAGQWSMESWGDSSHLTGINTANN